MRTHPTTPELTLASIALDLGAPPPPPIAPPNPTEALRSYRGCRERAEQMLAEAKTSRDRLDAQFWIDNADRQIARWQLLAERGQ